MFVASCSFKSILVTFRRPLAFHNIKFDKTCLLKFFFRFFFYSSLFKGFFDQFAFAFVHQSFAISYITENRLHSFFYSKIVSFIHSPLFSFLFFCSVSFILNFNFRFQKFNFTYFNLFHLTTDSISSSSFSSPALVASSRFIHTSQFWFVNVFNYTLGLTTNLWLAFALINLVYLFFFEFTPKTSI